MSPENQWLEDVFPIEIVPSKRGHVSFPGCIPQTTQMLVNIYHTLSIWGDSASEWINGW